MNKLKIVFFGSPYYSIPLLDKIINSGHEVPLVISQGTKKTRRGKIIKTDIHKHCDKHELKCITPNKLDDTVFHEINDLNADLGIIYAYGKLIPQKIIVSTKLGIMNLHCSLLPAYRGAAPIQHALMNNEDYTGITYFEINNKLDDGKILCNEKYRIKELDNCQSIQDNLTQIAVDNCLKAIEKMSSKNYASLDKKNSPSYARKLDKKDAYFTWDMNARLIFNKIRALHMWPVATTILFGESIKILDAKYQQIDHKYKHGTVITFNKKELIISAKDGFLSILKLQLEGKKPITCTDLYNSSLKLRHSLQDDSINI